MPKTALVLATLLAALFLADCAPAQQLHQTLGGCGTAAPLRTIRANPGNYRSLLNGLQPGDRLLLDPGTYTQGLFLWNKHGQPNRCIVVEGPATGAPALLVGSNSFNTVSLQNASYIAVRNLQLDGRGLAGDGVKGEGNSGGFTHHINLENLALKGYGPNNQRCGVSTKSPAWNWVVRRLTIQGAGVGMYFGNSGGGAEFVNGLVEHNLIYDTLGYGIQIKHQLQRSTQLGMPASATTILRHNVVSKQNGSQSGADARPNLLVGHWPLSGAGATDVYQIYGNLFYGNPYEALFQGEGNIALHDNLFVNPSGPAAVRIQRHNSVPRRIEIFNNTVVSQGTGITISGADAGYPQKVRGNAVFAATPLSGGQQSANVTGTYAAARTHLNAPYAPLGSLDLYPRSGKLFGAAYDTMGLSAFVEWDRDFNRLSRIWGYRGAYSGDGVNPGWRPALEIKPAP
ncbi:MAG TPA: hypothetical protein VF121_03315 [Thermoanaerobaculia bacterium]|nr:hypothetical protein [Thermoanaerobaculia bacterium]